MPDPLRSLSVAEFRAALFEWKFRHNTEDFLKHFPFADVLEFANIGANVVASRNNAIILPRIGTKRERDLG